MSGTCSMEHDRPILTNICDQVPVEPLPRLPEWEIEGLHNFKENVNTKLLLAPERIDYMEGVRHSKPSKQFEEDLVAEGQRALRKRPRSVLDRKITLPLSLQSI